MIQRTLNRKQPRIRLLPSEKLRSHFVALARQVDDWQAGGQRFSIGVAGIESGQGTSSVAFNLAAALSQIQNKKTLLVESVFGSPFASKRLPRRCRGLSELLSDKSQAAETIYPTRLEQMFVMSCGRMPKKPALGLPLESIHNLNAELNDDFHIAVFDLPQACDHSQFYPLVQQLDGVILVVDAKCLNAKKIQRVQNRLSDPDRLVGIVVNKAK